MQRAFITSLSGEIRVLRGILFLWGHLILSPVICLADSSDPFVPGFDRFSQTKALPENELGETLLTELSCTACHTATREDLVPKGGPNLIGVANRVQSEWMHDFLMAPAQYHPGTTMPDLLHGYDNDRKREIVDSLVAYLETLTRKFPELKATGRHPVPHEFWAKGNIERGAELFHKIGCVTCHDPDPHYEFAEQSGGTNDSLMKLIEGLDPEEIEELGLSHLAQPVRSVPYPKLDEKYTHESLTFFLHNPLQVRPAGRMPSFGLMPIDAADIAAYLLREQDQNLRRFQLPVNKKASQEALVTQGRKHFVSLGCVNCHAVPGTQEPKLAKSLAELQPEAASGCLKNPGQGAASFALNTAQANALKVALQEVRAKVDSKELPVSASRTTLVRLNCVACHERDGIGGVGADRRGYLETVGHVDIGDEGRLPPSLTNVGIKLQPKWIDQVLAGNAVVRPYLTVRMPTFSKQQTAHLAGLWASEDRPHTEELQPAFELETDLLQNAGRDLLDTGCVQCHVIRGERLPSVVGVDLEGVTSRIRWEWFEQFLRNPISMKERTRMPTFFPNGVSSNPDVLHGNVDHQIDAIWAYLDQASKLELPEKIVTARQQSFELIPVERPVLLRTFMKEAGTHAIAVGFPEQVHFGFDAENSRIAEVWRGRFLDALGTWFDRFSPPADPLGIDRMPLSNVVQFVAATKGYERDPKLLNKKPKFLGYRLDAARVPTFRSQLGSFLIEQTFRPGDDGGLKQSVRIIRDSTATGSECFGLHFRKGMAPSVEHPGQFTNKSPLRVTVHNDTFQTATPGTAELKREEGMSDVLNTSSVDLTQLYLWPDQDEITIELEYNW